MTKRKANKRCRRGRRSKSRKEGKLLSTILRLKKLKPHQRREAIGLANNKFIRDFAAQVKKLRRANLKASLKKRLQDHSKSLRKFVNSKTAIGSKRKMLLQRGGFLPLLLAALPAAGSIIGGLLSRRN